MKESKVMWILTTIIVVTVLVYSLFFSKPTYNVTFNANGGSAVAAQKVEKNGVATIPEEPKREGFTFKEWQVNGETYDFKTKVTGNVTVVAIWEEVPTTTTKKTTTKKTTTKKTTTTKTTKPTTTTTTAKTTTTTKKK